MYLALLDKYEREELGHGIGRKNHTALFEFALWLEKNAAQQSVQADEAICSAKYHVALAEKGDTRCGVCGQPLRW